MTPYEMEQDFEGLLEVTRRVAKHYRGNVNAMYLWWYTPQSTLEGKTPRQVSQEMHGERINSITSYLKKEDLIQD